MEVAESYYFTRAVGVPLRAAAQPRSSVRPSVRSMQSRSIWRFTLTAPTPRRSRRARARAVRPDSQRGFANVMGLPRLLLAAAVVVVVVVVVTSDHSKCPSLLGPEEKYLQLPIEEGNRGQSDGAARRRVLCVCNAQWKYQRKSSSPPPAPSWSRSRRQCPIGWPENEEAVIPSSGRARGSASNHSARFHSIPLWWHRRGPLNEYAESAFGSDQPAFLSVHEMTKYLSNDQSVIGVWEYRLFYAVILVFFWPIKVAGRRSPE